MKNEALVRGMISRKRKEGRLLWREAKEKEGLRGREEDGEVKKKVKEDCRELREGMRKEKKIRIKED